MSERDDPPAPEGAGTVLLAGVGETLGTALARAFAPEHPVALLARSPDHVEDLAADLRDEGYQAVAVTADVTDPDALAAAVDAARTAFGPFEVVVHNASAPGGGDLADCSPADFEATWRTRAFGGFLLARETVLDLRETEGTLLFAGTSMAHDGSARLVDWGSAAFATRGLARSLAADLAPDVHVAYVAIGGSVAPPDGYLTEGRMAADRVAAEFVHLAEQERSVRTTEVELGPGSRPVPDDG